MEKSNTASKTNHRHCTRTDGAVVQETSQRTEKTHDSRSSRARDSPAPKETKQRERESQPVSGKSAGKNKSLGTLDQEKSQARKSNAAHYETKSGR
jgi:hypothetical protein